MNTGNLLAHLSAPAAIHGAPFGYDLLALQAALEARGGVALYVARDDKTAATALKLAGFNHPAMELVRLPGWDNLPYDRISPSPANAAARCAALARLAQRAVSDGPCLVITTAGSLVQRVPPVETMRASSFAVAVGGQVNQAELTSYLGVNGYIRTSTVSEKGEYSIRGGKVDIFPPDGKQPVRLDLFGDEVETIKSFDPETQLSTRTLKAVALAPVSEILFREETQTLFRERYLAELGSPLGDPMYEAARAEIRRQGLESWLPLFHQRLDTLFEYIGPDALIGMGYLAPEAAAERLLQAKDYFEARLEAVGERREARVLPPEALYLRGQELNAALGSRGVARFAPSAGDGGIDLGGALGRNFAPERAKPEVNIFEATANHAKALRAAGKVVVFAAYTEGSAERLTGVMADHGLDDLGRVYSLEAGRQVGLALCELPLEAGYEASDLAVIAEPDVLGDRLAAPRRKRKAANFIAEAGSLNPGDLVVHIDHGVGR
ncbi:MAG: transcription-repair coupling factor, partial [Henriciella sp.]|nr:transcription-repair coupling factor [Henriciella sp.]